jgi:hypothetical protein
MPILLICCLWPTLEFASLRSHHSPQGSFLPEARNAPCPDNIPLSASSRKVAAIEPEMIALHNQILKRMQFPA